MSVGLLIYIKAQNFVTYMHKDTFYVVQTIKLKMI